MEYDKQSSQVAFGSPIPANRAKAPARHRVPVRSAKAMSRDMPNTSGSNWRLINNVINGSQIVSRINT